MMNNRSIPPSTVIPVLPYRDIVAAIDWLTGAFGFSLRLQIADHRAQLNAGDGAVVLSHNPSFSERSPVGYSVMVRVPDVDAHHDRAILYQARILAAPCDHPYGERQYTVADLEGHVWTFSQTIADVDPRDWGGTPVAL